VVLADTATWVVAVATVGLFVVTGLLFYATYKVSKTAGAQVKVEQSRVAAEQRPHVFPVSVNAWGRGDPPYEGDIRYRLLPLANAGPGVAHNVTGLLKFRDGVFVPIVPLTIPPGQQYDARLDWGGNLRTEGWDGLRGFALYTDLIGDLWLTDFYVRESNQGRFIDIEDTGPLAKFGNLYQRFQLVTGPARLNRPLERALALSSST
jgi:hypothetical protein